MNDKTNLDEMIRSISAFHDFGELLLSIEKCGYTPTLRPDAFVEPELQRAVKAVRNQLIALGLPMYPKRLPSDHLPCKCEEHAAGEVESETGIKKFNGGRHLVVDVPDGHFTIAARTSEGKVITFAFVPYEEGGAPQCVDVQHKHDGEKYNDSPVQKLIAFSGGGNAYNSECHKHAPVTLTTHILKD